MMIVGISESSAKTLQENEECINMNITKNIVCDDVFRVQSVKIFSVMDSSIGIITDPNTKLPLVDLGTFYGIGGNGTIPDKIEVYRDNHIWKITTKETGIAPSTSHSEWQIPQTFFFNELPGKYKLRLITNDTETLVFEFIVKQITEESKEMLENNMKDSIMEGIDENIIRTATSPLEQTKNGIDSRDVICKENMQLVFKNTDNSPACVKQATVDKLIERGWAELF